MYVTAAQWRMADATMSLVIRAPGDPTALASALRAAVWSVDKDQPIVRVATMDTLLAASAAERRFALILFETFALAALLLAAAGIYGVLSGRAGDRAAYSYQQPPTRFQLPQKAVWPKRSVPGGQPQVPSGWVAQ